MKNSQKSKNKTFKWLWEDLIYPRKKDFLINFLLDLGGILGQVAAYSVLLKYVNALEQTSELELLGRSFEPQSSQTLLIVVALTTGLLFLIYSLIDYWSKLRIINITRKYDEFCSRRILHALEKTSQTLVSDSGYSRFDSRRLRKALIKDARFCGKTVKVISLGFVILIKFLASLAFMFSVSILLTSAILLLIVPLAYILRRLGREVVKLTQLREAKLPVFIQHKKMQMQRAMDKNRAPNKEQDEFGSSNEILSFYNTYYKVMKKLALSDLIIVLFIAFLAVVVVLMAGNLVLFGNMSWAIFIAYIVAMRFFFSSMQGLNNMMKKASKLYDYVSHYIMTLEAAQSGKGVPMLEAYKREPLASTRNSDAIGLELNDDDGDDDDDDDDM